MTKTKNTPVGWKHGWKKRTPLLIEELISLYPEVSSDLDTSNPYEKVVATILSAQCTDKRVNLVTPALFKQYPDVESMSIADLSEVQRLVHSTGFYRNKSKNIIAMSKLVVGKFNSIIPHTMEELVELPGVARKTANCVLNDCYNIAVGVVVDTHVARLSIRLGLTSALKSNAVQIEKDLMEKIPKSEWINISHRLIYHGRRVCNSRKPKCNSCSVFYLCPYGNSQ
jgi:endonuclease III